METISVVGSWVLNVAAIGISILAYRKTSATDARDRSATIVIEPVWSEKHDTFTWIPRREDDSRPKPDLCLVITGTTDAMIRCLSALEKYPAAKNPSPASSELLTGYGGHLGTRVP